MREVSSVSGVESVAVDLAAKLVTVDGNSLDERRIRDAIVAAGYEAD
jgi:copper chaperone CopZ